MYEARQYKDVQRKTIDCLNPRKTLQIKSIRKNADRDIKVPLQMKTEIEYQTTLYNYPLPGGGQTSEIVGKKIHAFLDPKDPIKGSEPGSDVQSNLMEYLRLNNYKSLVRGHLLNAELGGLGIPENLFPITRQANSLHKMKVENYVKKELSNSYIAKTNNRIEYQVEAKENGKLPNITFECHYGKENSLTWGYSCNINSFPQKSSTGSGSTNWNAPSLIFLNKDLPQGWEHIGRGYNEKNIEHRKTLGRMIPIPKTSRTGGRIRAIASNRNSSPY